MNKTQSLPLEGVLDNLYMYQRESLQHIFDFYDHSSHIHSTSTGVPGKSTTTPGPHPVACGTGLGREHELDARAPVFKQTLTTNVVSLCLLEAFTSHLLAGRVQHEAIALH